MLTEYLEGTDGVIIVPIEDSNYVRVFPYAESETAVIELTDGFVLDPIVDPSVEKPTMVADHH